MSEILFSVKVDTGGTIISTGKLPFVGDTS